MADGGGVGGGTATATAAHTFFLMDVVWQSWGEVSARVWSDDFWLPDNVTWAQLESPAAGIEYPKSGDLLLAAPLAITFILLKIAFIRFVATPIGLRFGLKETKNKMAPTNHILESAFVGENGRLSPRDVTGLSKRLDWSEQQVERWLRHRRRQNTVSRLHKFCDSCWKFTYYVLIFLYGVWVLVDKSWFYNTDDCWTNYPFHPVSLDVKFYYILEAAYWWEQTVTHFFGVKRKDFYQMFMHHLVTLVLIHCSWTCNMVRIGSLVLLIHDTAHWSFEATKMGVYCRLNDRMLRIIFNFFTAAWFFTRLVIFPYRVLYSSLVTAHTIVRKSVWSCYLVYNTLLLLLQVMHVIWFYLIGRRCYLVNFKGQELKDDRSESDEANGNGDNGVQSAETSNGVLKTASSIQQQQQQHSQNGMHVLHATAPRTKD